MSERDDTADARHFRVGGRRWRRTDPAIPEPFRQALVNELMAARRTVGQARAAGDRDAERGARQRVQDAKVALGERGAPWWETPDERDRRARLQAAMLALLRGRRDGATLCPSEAARATCGADWRDFMALAREAAFELQDAGRLEVVQRGEPAGSGARGPLRLRLNAAR